MAEAEAFAKDAIRDVHRAWTRRAVRPLRAGDYLVQQPRPRPTFFMLCSTMPATLRQGEGLLRRRRLRRQHRVAHRGGHAGHRRPGPPAAGHPPLRRLGLPRREPAGAPTRLPCDGRPDRGRTRRDRRASRHARRPERNPQTSPVAAFGAGRALRGGRADRLRRGRPPRQRCPPQDRAGPRRVLYSGAGRSARSPRSTSRCCPSSRRPPTRSAPCRTGYCELSSSAHATGSTPHSTTPANWR